MTTADVVYNLLRQSYADNEPIFLSGLRILDKSSASVRQQIRNLAADGRLKCFDDGIYFIPGPSGESTLSVEEVIKRKYLMDGTSRCGYFGGLMFANAIGLKTKVPMVYDLSTNKATTKCRETKLAGFRIIIRRPYARITEENASTLQFLDLMADLDRHEEWAGPALTKCLRQYCAAAKIDSNSLRTYVRYYPSRIYGNLYQAGLLQWDIGPEDRRTAE